MSAGTGMVRPEDHKAAFRASTGLELRVNGKRALVLEMLASESQGITQWDCLPWHTRLGASIHALREAGLTIETRREGKWRHARYFLRTEGSLIIREGNGEAASNSAPEKRP